MEHFQVKIINIFIVILFKSNNIISSVELKETLIKTFGYQEAYLNFTELVSRQKYQTEEHQVVTEDGYILTIFRILPKCTWTRSYPVLLMHGILDSSDLWIIAGPRTGLGYILSNNCYDVWAANHRGNHYSRKHVQLDPDKDPDFWNYSFDEHGFFDVPATIDYILRTTGRPKLSYIGHSQGTTDFFVMTSLKPGYNVKIRLAVNIAPVAWLRNIASPLPIIAAHGGAPIKAVFDAVGVNELFAKDHLPHSFIQLICQIAPEHICGKSLSISTGYMEGTIRSKTLAVASGHSLDGVSTKNLAHFGQLIVSREFQRYDEGREGNMKKYGTPKPPCYNTSQITSPVVLINAQSDWLSSLKDTTILISKLPNLIETYVVPQPYWSHHNHIWGVKAPIYVFSKILYYLNRYDI